jgi:hypothetical protein
MGCTNISVIQIYSNVIFTSTYLQSYVSYIIEQRMGPLPDHRVGPCPVFQSVAVDLFGPAEHGGITNKRQTGKGWGFMFVYARPYLSSTLSSPSHTPRTAFSWPSGDSCAREEPCPECSQTGAIKWSPLLSKQSTGTSRERGNGLARKG